MPPGYSGTACKNCRRRGRKCSKELPNCQSCVTKGLTCEGYTLRWAGLASRGRLAGKTTLAEVTISPKSSPEINHTATILSSPLTSSHITSSPVHESSCDTRTTRSDTNTATPSSTSSSPSATLDTATAHEFDFNSIPSEDHVGAERPRDQADNSGLPAATDLVLQRNSLSFYTIPAELSFILGYHLQEVAPRLCVDTGSVKNPYSQNIFPLAVQKPPLLYACAALAACHYSVRLSDRRHLVDSLRFRGKAMRRLQECLWSEQSAKDEGNLTAVLMLTLTDLCLGGPSNFDAHFKAARMLIDLRGEEKTQDAFVEQYIAWLDIMSAASTNRKPLFTTEEVVELTGPSKTWSHDVFPCPPDQFAIISEVIKLYKSQDDPAHPTPVTLSIAEARKSELLVQPLHTERGESWLHLTEAYRHAIALYIIRLFNCSTNEDEVAWLTQSVFHHARKTAPRTGYADMLLWPIFHAGLEVRDERRKKWLRERSIVMQESGGFANVATAMDILERVWKSDAPPDYTTLFGGNASADMFFV